MVEEMAQSAANSGQPPSVEQLTEYITGRVNRGRGPVPDPEPEAPKSEAQPPIRKARRVDF